ncbi:hypothetical protein [Burkholderia anthina]|uniref:Morphogenetic protein n=1 Tax=Burkholderia anthina TaxID=179879 RepID=A0A6P2GDM6_9BURK|nr:hypothetical protein [Burkholderia anthina]MBM2769869.1 hypothetical protein [Burkholderia anthina]VVU51843.1 hypothetical protein BAN20980_04566 [Burkholderia anthina]
MKERPILFNAPMVRAILEGRKTQTRRVMKPQPIEQSGWVGGAYWERKPARGMQPADQWCIRDMLQFCPHGQLGDRLWVRETTYDVERNGWVGPVYVESDEGAHASAWGWGESDDPDYIEPYELRRRPAIHMPRSMARITLEITGVRAERLQSISEADARAEGVMIEEHHMRGYCAGAYRPPSIRAFHYLWDGLNAARGHGWDANPWVWVIEFKRID